MASLSDVAFRGIVLGQGGQPHFLNHVSPDGQRPRFMKGSAVQVANSGDGANNELPELVAPPPSLVSQYSISTSASPRNVLDRFASAAQTHIPHQVAGGC